MIIYIYVYGGATGRRAAGGFLSKASTQYPYYPKLDYYYPLLYRKAQHCFASCPGLAQAHVGFRSRKW
jgi:hypothetical protein